MRLAYEGGMGSPKPVALRDASSWMALLATTMGVDDAGTLRTEIRTDGDIPDTRTYRLVVQSYGTHAGLPTRRSRPVASAQRAVTAAELRQGVRVNLVELRNGELDRPTPSDRNKALVVAWVEEGKPDLEFDGWEARPKPGSIFGSASRDASRTVLQISMKRAA
jgi:hypothetical protein